MTSRTTSVLLAQLAIAGAFVLAVLASVGSAAGGSQDLSGAAPNPITRTWTFDRDPDREAPRYGAGADLRLRYVDFKNVLALGAEPDPHRRFMRMRTRLWGEGWFGPGWRLFAQIGNEARDYLECNSCESKLGEVVVENLFFEFSNQEGNPFGLRIGRQDLFYGDGFVICDGTPLDGSRTSYVNGILLTASMPGGAFDVFAVWNRERDEWLPRINSQHTALLEYDEFVGGLYVRGFDPEDRSKPYTTDFYYIYKRAKTSDRRAHVNTFGTRLVLDLRTVRISGEMAFQGGRAPESRFVVADPELAGSQPITAYGGQIEAVGRPKAALPLDLIGGYVHLSGDDPLTRNKFEGWNPVMGRWPRWSELYIYTLGAEARVQPMGEGVANWRNFKAPYFGIVFSPYPEISLDAGHMWMRAATGSPFEPSISPGSEPERSKDRGRLLAVRISYRLQSVVPLTGHILYERFDPGGYYYYPEAKVASFLRVELGASL
jgi:hypothetical protein